MIMPPGLLAVSALFWGWQSQMLVTASGLAIVLEASRFTEVRFQFTSRDYQRIADFCTWVFVFITGYYVVTKGWPFRILLIVEWLPLVIAPLVCADRYGAVRGVELSALFMSLRTQRQNSPSNPRVDLTYPFVVTCLLAAGASNLRTDGYYIGIAIIAMWGLWGVRSPRYARGTWVMVICAAIAAGYAGHMGLNRLQTAIFNLAIEYLHFDPARTDPYRASTDIGHIGDLKSSSRILLRVDVPATVQSPVLLHRASYNAYAHTTWLARDAQFEVLAGDAEQGVWVFGDVAPEGGRYTVSEVLASGSTVLSLPAGSMDLAGLAGSTLRRNRLGTVRIDRAPGAVTYLVTAAGVAPGFGTPTAQDLRVPADELPSLQAVLREIAPVGASQEAMVMGLKRHFAQHFRYSTYRARRVDAPDAIREFLSTSRSGHCEYFATATVLLARAAGIPARYSTGYSVQEWSALEGRYVVRERHAHAWASVYFNGEWRFVDTTPPEWFGAESKDAPAWERAADLWSWLINRYQRWRDDPQERGMPIWAILLLMILVGILLWRLTRGGAFARKSRPLALNAAPERATQAASPFYDIEAALRGQYGVRGDGESLSDWLLRIERFLSHDESLQLRELLRLHYRLRFDPNAKREALIDALAVRSKAWLARARLDASPSPHRSQRA
jgi:hypothetical protein